jgi:hypothetical protein
VLAFAAMGSIVDPIFAPPLSYPFPAGTSPFRQKGNGYIGDLAHLDTCVAGGAKAVIAAIPDPGTRFFFSQRFRASDWYDAFPGAALHATAAQLRGLSLAEHRLQVGAYHASTAGSVYRALLRMLSNEAIAVWGPRVSSIYFEFGKFETRATGPNQVEGFRRGMPAGLVQNTMHGSRGFTEETLRLAGAKTAHFEIGSVEPGGRLHTQALYDAAIRVRWT